MSEFDDIFGSGDNLYHTSPPQHSAPAPPPSYPPPTTTPSRPPYNGGASGKRGFINPADIPPAEFPLPPVITLGVSLERDTPMAIIERLVPILGMLSNSRFTVRTAHTSNAELDKLLISKLGIHKQIIIPWKNFVSEAIMPPDCQPASLPAKRLAAFFQDGWESIKPAIQAFLARDTHVIVGTNGQSPVAVYIVWTADGAENLSTLTAVSKYYKYRFKLCQTFNIPIINLNNADAIDRLKRRLEQYQPVTADAPSYTNP